MRKNKLSFKEKAGVAQEECLCFCEEETSREAMFQAPIELPEGFVVDPAEAVANVTWNADSLSCVSERCLIQTGPEPDEVGVQFAVRLQGTVTLLVSVSPVRNQYGQGNGAVSVIHNVEIDQVVYYSDEPDDCPDLSEITIENLVVVPPFYGSPLSVTGTIVLVPEPEPEPVYAFTANPDDQSVSVIDTNTHAVFTTIALPFEPTGIEMTPDKNSVFVLHFNNNMISVIDYDTLTVNTSILLDQPPETIKFVPEHDFAYVLAGNAIYVIRIETSTVERSIPVEGYDIAIDPNGLFAYVLDFGLVQKVDLSTGEVTGTIERELIVNSIETKPPERYAYVLEEDHFFNYLTIIDLNTFTISSTQELEYEGEYLMFTSGSEVYLFDGFTHNLYSVSPGGADVIGNLPQRGNDFAFTPNGEFLYATHFIEQSITVYNTGDYSVETVIPLGVSPSAIAI
ncbi:YncE family protein [Bacillus inaquosorum]|uniref:YncE family protein n=2 Tax=Bacillus inaquosorum TaxID=483913 RepID=UPI0022801B67|nr:YncE family protein [Bacillus inaquosorum]MCY8137966.1 YncE family protein [Bacillus inaquosorum]MCY8274035.1 YncE family protein [Bacillus inaquosorum]MCY8388339.1 YncE family protein [Bacillus inaquosorum]MCY8729632.1 YncE family protein [Bacillus inaquosorum]MCY8797529.1 YncE family protein [Bacillus inaquosorum]